MNPIEQNLNNLIDLWKKYGSVSRSFIGVELYQNVSWPNRVWLEKTSNLEPIKGLNSHQLEKVIQQIAPSSILPVIEDQTQSKLQNINLSWLNHSRYFKPLLDKNQYAPIFQLTAMHKMCPVEQDSKHKTELTIKVIQSENHQEQLKAWIEITNEAFQYKVDPNVIQGLLTYPEVTLLVFYLRNNPIASALLNVSQNTIGIHQVGVKKSMQGQGIGLKVMQDILQFSANLNAQSLVLQASKAGIPLYRKLGFCEQFKINHYWIENK